MRKSESCEAAAGGVTMCPARVSKALCLDNAVDADANARARSPRIVVATKDKVTRLPTSALRFRPDEDSLKAKKDKDASKEKTRAEDDGVLTAMNGGRKVYRIYTVGEKQEPKVHDVTIGIANTRFTELISGDLKAGDEVITRSAEPAVKK